MAPQPMIVADLWKLNAMPEKLTEAAEDWRRFQEAVESAADSVDSSAGRVTGDGSWEGESADAYDNHRRKVTRDLRELTRSIGDAARILREVAGALRSAQGYLDDEWRRLTSKVKASMAPGFSVGVGRGGLTTPGLDFNTGQVTLVPEDEAQVALVNQAIAEAGRIRSRLDSQLDGDRSALRRVQGDIAEIAAAWRLPANSTQLRMLSLNIGQGWGNSIFSGVGTDPEDMDVIAARIKDSGANVAALQEVFGKDVKALERELERQTGDKWTIHFGQASEKMQVADNPFSLSSVNEPFGNAVAVRHGGPIESSTSMGEPFKMDRPGDDGTEGRSMPGAVVQLAD